MIDLFGIIWRELKTPDAYPNNWYGYAKNQLSHFMLGFTAACVMSHVHFTIFDEFAQKGALWASIAMMYAIYELSSQGWQGKDTVEDWFFFAIYGAGVPIFMFNEIEQGSPVLTVNATLAIPAVAVIYGHLIVGIIARIITMQARND